MAARMIAGALALAMGFCSNPVQAQGLFGQPPPRPQDCDTRAAWVDYLKEVWHERLTGYGATPTGGIVEVWSGPDGTWTLLVSSQDGSRTCVAGGGDGWRSVPLPGVAT